MAFPACEFEAATGLSGISRKYKMPKGLSADFIENQILEIIRDTGCIPYTVQNTSHDDWIYKFRRAVRGNRPPEEAREYLGTLAQTFKDLNLELAGVAFPPDSIPHLYNFVMGVTSGFNPDDIRHYLTGLNARSSQTDQEMDRVQRLFLEIQGRKEPFGWKPGSETLTIIARQLEDRVACTSASTALARPRI